MTAPAAPRKTEPRVHSDTFPYEFDFHAIDFRQRPDLYRIGKGEQGVLSVEPYKSEILPLWRFRTPEIARESSAAIYQRFLAYLDADDFIGADMARKFLQMGYTRARRYANHKGGKKYDGPVPDDKKGLSGAHGRATLPYQNDQIKAEAAQIFYEKWQQAKTDPRYQQQMQTFRDRYEKAPEPDTD